MVTEHSIRTNNVMTATRLMETDALIHVLLKMASNAQISQANVHHAETQNWNFSMKIVMMETWLKMMDAHKHVKSKMDLFAQEI